jgi:hypothetical protein
MRKLGTIDKWVEKMFADSPNLRAILQLDPTGVGSAFEVMLSHKIAEMRNLRFRTLLDELSSGDKELTPELIDSEEFLHAFFCVTKASLDSRREEKIRLFGRLLLYAAKTNMLHTDMLEEFVSILDDLSIREFQILRILHNYENTAEREENQNDLQFATSFWGDFEELVNKELGVNKNELPSMLVRLNRTGLYETFTGSFLGYRGDKGKTTFLFEKFIQWIKLKE